MSDRRFSTAPGPYDYPPASESPNTSAPAYDFDAIPTRLQNLRQRLTDERFHAVFNTSSPDGSDSPRRAPLPPMPPDAEAQNRMRSVLRAIHDNEGSPPSELALPPAAPGRTISPLLQVPRRRAQPSERFQRLNDQRVGRFQGTEAESSDSTFSLHEASERLAQSNEDLRNLLDRPIHGSRPNTSRFVAGDDTIHSSESQHRRKRRRTDGPTLSKSENVRPVEYGYRGQIKPGSLDMEIRHSDMSDLPPTYETTDGWNSFSEKNIQNILRDDAQPFVARCRRANIIMQHSGQRLFTVNRLVIKLPDSEDDEYALQGLVFTSRAIDKQFDRTTHYQIHHFPASRFGTQSRPGPHRLRNFLRAMGRDLNSPPHEPEDEGLRRGVSADCDAEDDAAASYDSADSRRPSNVVGSNTGAPSSSDTESSSGSSSSESVFPGMTPPRERAAWTSSRVAGGLLHERRLENSDGDNHAYDTTGDDPDDVAAQFDFDEVLRRGAAVSADRRRRRAATRERVRQRMQWSADSRAATGAGSTGGPSSDTQPGLPPASPNQLSIAPASHPRLPEAAGPPAQLEDRYWDENPRVQFTDSLSAYPSVLGHERVEPESYLTKNDLLEPAAFFSSNRRMQYRYFTRARKSPSKRNDAQSSRERVNPASGWQSASAQRGEHAATINYKAKSYGGRITIDFDTPISTRYLLLKLWKSRRTRFGLNAENASHEDVRLTRVRIEGWCGVRWFPATEAA